MIRRTPPVVRVARILTTGDRTTRHFAYPLSRRAGVRSGTIYTVLDQLMALGWVTAAWTTPNTHSPRGRRYYSVTARGALELRALAMSHHRYLELLDQVKAAR